MQLKTSCNWNDQGRPFNSIGEKRAEVELERDLLCRDVKFDIREMKRAYGFWAALALTLIVYDGSAEETGFKTLSFTDGTKVEAKAVTVRGNKIDLLRSDGSRGLVELGQLTPTDRKALEEWALFYMAAKEELFGIQVSGQQNYEGSSSGRANFRVFVNGRDTGVHEKRVTTKECSFGYRIDVENKSGIGFGNLDVGYQFYCSAYTDEVYLRGFGCFPINEFPAGEILRFYTEPIKDAAYGGRPVTKLEGIWLRFYKEGKMVFEYSRPASLRKSMTWEKTSTPR